METAVSSKILVHFYHSTAAVTQKIVICIVTAMRTLNSTKRRCFDGTDVAALMDRINVGLNENYSLHPYNLSNSLQHWCSKTAGMFCSCCASTSVWGKSASSPLSLAIRWLHRCAETAGMFCCFSISTSGGSKSLCWMVCLLLCLQWNCVLYTFWCNLTVSLLWSQLRE